MSEDGNHKECEYYMPQNDSCLNYCQLGAFNVSQYKCCYKKLIWGEEE